MQPCARITVGNTLGECVLWDDAEAALWWTDIDGRMLYRLDWSTGAVRRIPTPERLASFGFIAGQSEFVAAFDCGFALFNPDTGSHTPFLSPSGLEKGMRMNDGRVDHRGRFWCGAMVMNPAEPPLARLYAVQGGMLGTHADGIAISNGICWSPDGRFFYFADSRRGLIWRYAFDMADGILGQREVFARVDGVEPDGACVDADGCLWSAQWGGSRIIRYTPDGRIDRILEVPVRQPTCVTFGGPNLDLLFVTSARLGLKVPETGAGDVLVYNVKAQGLPESRFRIDSWPSIQGDEAWRAPMARI